MTNFSKLSEHEIAELKTKFAAAVEDLRETYGMLRLLSDSESIEILFHDTKEGTLYDKIKGTKVHLKHLDDKTMLGHAFKTKKAYLCQDVTKDTRYTLAIDNPFKIVMRSQMIIPVVFNGTLEGVLRFSKNSTRYTQNNLDAIRLVMHSFREIFLNERYRHDKALQKHPLDLETFDVYTTLKAAKSNFEHLLKHTENPEMEKLLMEVQTNIDSIFHYLNPNLDNISRVKNELRQLKKNNLNREKGMRVLIADDVQMNVKILNSLLSHDDAISEILAAYDGDQTCTMLQNAVRANTPIDIVFLDHHMPGKLGLDVAETLKRDHDASTIIVSITNDPDAIKHRKELYDYHLSKPFAKASVDAILTNIKNSPQWQKQNAIAI